MKQPSRRKFVTPAAPASADPLQTGLAHHRAGRLSQALASYSAILAANPRHADALNLSGVIARQQGDLDTSQRLITRAIAINPNVATYHHHLGRTCHAQQRPADAIAHFRKAIALNPSDLDSLLPLSELLIARSKHAEAASFLERALALNPQCVEIYHTLGAIHKMTRDYDSALSYYRRAAALFPQSSDSHFNLALTLYEAGLFADAIPAFQQLLALKPQDHEAHTYLGQAFHELVDYPAARGCYCKALALNPEYNPALENLGALCMDTEDYDNAETLLRRAVLLQPSSINALTNLGVLLSKKGLTLQAIQSLKSVLTIDPNCVTALCGLGLILFNLGDEDAAESCYRLAFQAEPTSSLALFNLSSSLLAAGRFAEGWQAYERRWQIRHFMPERQILPQPRWSGEGLNGQDLASQDLTGLRLYLHSEQGFGDTLQFVRYAIALADRGAHIILAVQPGLIQLLQDIHPSIHVMVKGHHPIPPFDFYCPLLSLPYVLKSDLSNLPSHTPYLQPRPHDLPAWSERIESPNLRVGIVWSGNPLHTRDRIRSIPWAIFSRVLHVPGITFYSLQKGPAVEHLPMADHVVNLDPQLNDFTDTAAAIAHLDLVIAVDTSVAHLAGALGKPVWILHSHAADWRWLKHRTDSPWYPTARLFRQSALNQWDPVIDDLCQSLTEIVVNRKPWTQAALTPPSVLTHQTAASR